MTMSGMSYCHTMRQKWSVEAGFGPCDAMYFRTPLAPRIQLPLI